MLAVALAAVGSALSALVVAPAPSYDPWAWLLWGREIAGGELSTAEGPAFKPLPVAVTTLLSVLGGAAPAAWVLVARVGAILALWLAFRLGRRLAADVVAGADEAEGRAMATGGWRLAAGVGGGAGEADGRAMTVVGGWPVAAGVLAAAGVALSGAYLSYAATGIVTGWLLALALAGVEAWRAGRRRLALACGVGCALLQVESWPFLLAFGLVLWRRRAQDRVLLAAAALAVPALWFVPELLGSGDLLRSAERAQIPNPGQPALAEVPAVASVHEAAVLVAWPLWAGVAALAVVAGIAARHRRGVAPAAGTLDARVDRAATSALVPALAGLAWIAIVAAMAQLGGFSGEPRYALPGAALVAISGAVGLAAAGRRLAPAPEDLERFAGTGRQRTYDRLRRAGAAAVLGAAVLAVLAAPRIDDVRAIRASQAHDWRAADALADAVRAAGGREAVLACGQPYVGSLRGPLMAYRLGVAKHVVEPDLAPRAPGVVFQTVGAEPQPPASPAFAEVARNSHWRVLRSCRVRMP